MSKIKTEMEQPSSTSTETMHLSSLSTKGKGTDDFWKQLEEMLAKHETQMESLTHRAVEIRTSLSNDRKVANTVHVSRMKNATEELEALKQQIAEYQTRVETNHTDVLEAKEAKVKEEIAQTNSDIEQLTRRISIMRNSSKQLREKLEESRSKADLIAEQLADRKRKIEEREQVIGTEISDAILKIDDLEEELSALETKEMACTALYARLQKDLPIAQRIFGKM